MRTRLVAVASLLAVLAWGGSATIASARVNMGSSFGDQPGGTRAAGAPRRYHVPVLMYHRIAPASERGRDLADLVIDPRVFDAQLAELESRGWHTITSAQLARSVAANVTLPARTFVITIDDGREDGYTRAFPILEKHGFVATFFVITGRVNHRNYLTWAELREMQAAGMEIGNHTVSHLDETRYGRSRTDRQVLGAQAAIWRNLGARATSFAFPSGSTPTNLVKSVRESGLTVAFTTAGGANETASTAFFWPRVRIHPTTTPAGILWLVRPYGPISVEPRLLRPDRHRVRHTPSTAGPWTAPNVAAAEPVCREVCGGRTS